MPDVALLVAAASSDGTGIALVAGTGSTLPGDRIVRAGWLARAVGVCFLGTKEAATGWADRPLGAVVRAADGRDPPTALTEAVLS